MMEEWITKIRPPKFLRYLFFIAYSWYRRFSSERKGSHIKAILLLSIGHVLVFSGITFFIPLLEGVTHVYVILLITVIQFYVWFVYKEKWKLFIEEFKHIDRRQQKRHVAYLFVYLLICGLPILIPVIMDDIWWE